MLLQVFKGVNCLVDIGLGCKIMVAKNYLSEKEICSLERNVSTYFDYVERLLEEENLLGM